MKRSLIFASLMLIGYTLFAQKVDSLYFNLYTDSLKKGQHNYINIDAKLSSGLWRPLTDKEIEFSCPTATFEGNQLVIPENFKEEKVIVKAVLKTNPSTWIERTIWIKKNPDPILPTNEEILKKDKKKKTKD